MAESSSISLELVVPNRLGLHARAAARLVQTLAPFRARVLAAANGREVNAKSILGVMTLAAAQGTAMRFVAEGEEAEAALAAIRELFARRFDEDD